MMIKLILQDFLNDLKNRKEENILIVTHNGVCRAINIYFNGIPEDKNIINLGIKNCEVVKYNCDKSNDFIIYSLVTQKSSWKGHVFDSIACSA